MPTTIRTERARIALAHREYEQEAAMIERELNARAAVLKRDSRAVDLASFQKLCIADPEFGRLVLEREAMKVWRDSNIKDDCVAVLEDDGTVRWIAPQFAGQADVGKPN